MPLRTGLVKVRVCWSLTAALGKPCVFKLGLREGRGAAAPRGGERLVQYNMPEQSLQGIVLQNLRSVVLQLCFDD